MGLFGKWRVALCLLCVICLLFGCARETTNDTAEPATDGLATTGAAEGTIQADQADPKLYGVCNLLIKWLDE